MYDPLTKTLDEERIKEAIRKSIEYSLDKTNIKDSAICSRSIHYNTNNINITIYESTPTSQRGKELKELKEL